MLHAIIDDALWSEVSKILPPEAKKGRTGRHRMDDRAVLSGIVLVLQTRMAWENIPCELGLGSGMTCLRRLREWQKSGIWNGLRDLLASRLRLGDRIPWWRADAQGAVVRTILRKQSLIRQTAPPPLRLVY
jgi:transposase